jgi:hypothetical protein
MLFYIEARDGLMFMASLCISAGAILFLLLVRVKQWQRPALWRAVAAIFLAGYLLVIVRALGPTAMIGVLATLPLIIFTLLFVERSLSPQPARLVYELVAVRRFIVFYRDAFDGPLLVDYSGVHATCCPFIPWPFIWPSIIIII